MAKLLEHPAVLRFRERAKVESSPRSPTLDAEELRQACLDAGADDVGFVSLADPAVAGERAQIESVLPGAAALISIVCRMNRDPLRSPARSVANLEFHSTTDEVDETCRRIVKLLESRGVRALNPACGFPMEADRFGEKMWVISHKPVAVAAGLGKMGIHRNVIHPRFGNFILLGTVIVDSPISAYGQPLDYNPCLECKLCVAACPVGAIKPDGAFDFSACYTHNYREFMGGFSDWVETIAGSKSAWDYRQKVSDPQTVSMWQSLAYGPNYKAAYCLSVCPAGDDVIAPFLTDKPRFVEQVVRPLQEKRETLYVLGDSDAEQHAVKRFPHKTIQRVRNGLRVSSIERLLRGMSLTFQREKAKGVSMKLNFTFTGREPRCAAVQIADGSISVTQQHHDLADLHVTVDSDAWLGIVNKDRSPLMALLRRKMKVKGNIRLLNTFSRCFA